MIDNNKEEGKTVDVWLVDAKKITSDIIKNSGHAVHLNKRIAAAFQKKSDKNQKRKDDTKANLSKKKGKNQVKN